MAQKKRSLDEKVRRIFDWITATLGFMFFLWIAWELGIYIASCFTGE